MVEISKVYTIPKFSSALRGVCQFPKQHFFSGLCETSGVYHPKVVLFDCLVLFLFLGGACLGGRSEFLGETGEKYDTTD